MTLSLYESPHSSPANRRHRQGGTSIGAVTCPGAGRLTGEAFKKLQTSDPITYQPEFVQNCALFGKETRIRPQPTGTKKQTQPIRCNAPHTEAHSLFSPPHHTDQRRVDPRRPALSAPPAPENPIFAFLRARGLGRVDCEGEMVADFLWGGGSMETIHALTIARRLRHQCGVEKAPSSSPIAARVSSLHPAPALPPCKGARSSFVRGLEKRKYEEKRNKSTKPVHVFFF